MMNAKYLPLIYVAGAALVAGVIYFTGRKLAGAANDARLAAADTVASGVEMFFPLVREESLQTYAVWFPDGLQHAVNADEVDKSGYFVWPRSTGTRYLLKQDRNGRKVALPA